MIRACTASYLLFYGPEYFLLHFIGINNYLDLLCKSMADTYGYNNLTIIICFHCR